MKSILVAVVITILVSGCATSAGNMAMKEQSADSISSQIVEGKTTKTEVLHALGSPSNT